MMKNANVLCRITDLNGNYYRLDANNNLLVSTKKSEATTFPIKEAQARVGTGKKSKFYRIQPLDEYQNNIEPVNARTSDSLASLAHNWEGLLEQLIYLTNHVDEYQAGLNHQLSDVDKEISDILHYLEFHDLFDDEMLKVSRMLQERRRLRREIKDEMQKTDLIKDTFLDSSFKEEVEKCLQRVLKMGERQYTPRKLDSLFQFSCSSVSA